MYSVVKKTNKHANISEGNKKNVGIFEVILVISETLKALSYTYIKKNVKQETNKKKLS